MVSQPSYDPTQFSRGIPPQLWKSLIEDENRPLRDKTIQDHYSPGSTFKTITAIAGFMEGFLTDRTRFRDFHRCNYNIAQARIAATRSAKHLETLNHSGSRVICDNESGFSLDHIL
jgi:cell division protein FtsI/penicillin-binding protein 2